MRMHRGSSKDGGRQRPPAEILPLSASPPTVRVEVEWTPRHRAPGRTVEVASGTTVRTLLHSLGEHPEGVAVFVADRSVPLDLPITAPLRLTIVRTFSGG